MKDLSRREVIVLGSTAAAAIMVNPAMALAEAKPAKALLEKFTGGKTIASGKIKLEMPEIAENGNTVPLSFTVESPMTKKDYVKRVIIIAEGNPRAEVATFNFSHLSGVAKASSRMRLAKTQNVMAVAELSDGTFHMAKTEVKVTIGGCGG
ncbi:thiosulfate oxidation carrier protein SoxY [Hyphomicrobiales bacterium 4NK60-0047b]|jgi:sulfur-oxidizing protein SoxY